MFDFSKKEKSKNTKPIKKEKQEKPQKPQKEQVYKMKKTSGIKVLRSVFWIMIVFIFLVGIRSLFVKGQTTDNQSTQTEDQESINSSDLYSYAESFAKVYTTYAKNGDEDFLENIKPYVAENISKTSNIYDFSTNSTCTYANAYRYEKVSENQIDVYTQVSCDIVYYTTETVKKQKTEVKNYTTSNYTLKIPISILTNGYVVENLPSIVSDDTYYDTSSYSTSTETPEEVNVDGLETSIDNFLKAYYAEDQSVIDYYLSSTANESDFCGLLGTDTFDLDSISSCSCYAKGNDEYICVVQLKLKNKTTKEDYLQSFSILTRKTDEEEQFYIEEINTRVNDLF